MPIGYGWTCGTDRFGAYNGVEVFQGVSMKSVKVTGSFGPGVVLESGSEKYINVAGGVIGGDKLVDVGENAGQESPFEVKPQTTEEWIRDAATAVGQSNLSKEQKEAASRAVVAVMEAFSKNPGDLSRLIEVVSDQFLKGGFSEDVAIVARNAMPVLIRAFSQPWVSPIVLSVLKAVGQKFL